MSVCACVCLDVCVRVYMCARVCALPYCRRAALTALTEVGGVVVVPDMDAVSCAVCAELY